MTRQGVAGIFGESVVDVESDPFACAWTVKTTDGRVIMQVPWRWAYDQTGLGSKRPRRPFLTSDEIIAHTSRWEAFEMCMCACPLTSAERLLLENRFPGVTCGAMYVVLNPVWWPPDVDRQRPRPRASPDPTPRPVLLAVDMLDTPANPPETSHEAGDRKLLL